MTDKPTDKIADAIGDGEIVSGGADAPTPAPLAKDKPKAKLNANQRRRKNAASAKADKYMQKADAAGDTGRIDAAETARGDKIKTTAAERKAAQDAELKEAKAKAKQSAKKPASRSKKEKFYSEDEFEMLSRVQDYTGLANCYITPSGKLKFWRRDDLGLPEGCPITPLGKLGDTYIFLDSLLQIVEYPANKLGNSTIKSLFAPYIAEMEAWWPVITEDKKTHNLAFEDKLFMSKSWKSGATQSALMSACSKLGVWSAAHKVRGRGAWADDDGNIIYHCGDKLWHADGAADIGLYQGHVYPAETKIPAPWDDEVGDGDSPALTLYELFRTWNWERPDIDPILLVGWIGCSVLSGALKWRPMVFVTGDKASGKSTIQEIIKQLFGDGLLDTADTTPAGIYQEVRQSCLPIAIDELENQSENRRQRDIIKLARLASSGAVMYRGGADHKGTQYTIRSCFLMSSILMPPMESQDLSRMAILNLRQLQHGQSSPDINPKLFRDYGRQIKRRMIDQWPHFKKVLEFYQVEMTKRGHESRAADQFGTLLAAAHVMQSEYMPSETSTKLLMDRMAPSKLLEIADNSSNAENCLQYLLESEIANWKGGNKKQVSSTIYDYAEGNEEAHILPFATTIPDHVRDDLASVGMAIAKIMDKKTGVAIKYLAVGISHKQVIAVFENSNWKSQANAKGVWAQALGRIPNAIANHVVAIAKKPTRCVCVPLAQIFKDKDDYEILKHLHEGYGDFADEYSHDLRERNRDEIETEINKGE